MPIRISIITPSFQQRSFLEQTARSILSQQGEFELTWIVVDGGSTDGSVEFLKGLADDRVQWTSGPDGGQSNAVNQGMERTSSELIGWLNSDDLYCPGTLATVAAAFQPADVQWFVGRCQIIDDVGRVIRPGVTAYKNNLLKRYSYRRLLRENFIAQPAVFWRRSFGQSIGPLDESLHYSMDYDLWLRMGKQAAPLIGNATLAQFRIHSGSKSGQVRREQFDEGFHVAKRYFAHDTVSRLVHRFNVEKIVWAYRAMRLVGK